MDNEFEGKIPLEKNPDFLLSINFEPGLKDPQRIFSTVAQYLNALQDCDKMLLKSFPVTIKPVFVLEKVETGSIKIWMKELLEAIPDEALINFDWKPAIGKYLVKGKYLLLKKLGFSNSLPTQQELGEISNELHELAKETEVLKLPVYSKISEIDIAREAMSMSKAIENLHSGESISYECDDGDTKISAGYTVTQEEIDKLLINEIIENEFTIILMVRKPDFLGETKWEFRYDGRNLSVSLDDVNWLAKFQDGEIDIRPGDALRVIMLEKVSYDFHGEVIATERSIKTVLGVIRKKEQLSLFK